MLSKKIGFSTNIFDNPSDMACLVDRLADSYHVVEIEFEKQFRAMIDDNDGYWQKERDALKDILKDRDVYFSFHAPYIGIETDISNKDEVIRLSAVDYLKKYVIKAAEIGGKIITIHPGYVEFDDNGVRDFDFTQLTRSLKKLATVSAEYGVSILLENTGQDRDNYILLSDEQHDYLCKECNVGLTLDLVHFHSFYSKLSTDSYFKHLKNVLPNIRNAHFNDVLNGEHIHLPLKQGNFNFHQVLKFMHEEGYQGNFIIEESGGGFAPDSFVDAGQAYIEQLNTETACVF